MMSSCNTLSFTASTCQVRSHPGRSTANLTKTWHFLHRAERSDKKADFASIRCKTYGFRRSSREFLAQIFLVFSSPDRPEVQTNARKECSFLTAMLRTCTCRVVTAPLLHSSTPPAVHVHTFAFRPPNTNTHTTYISCYKAGWQPSWTLSSSCFSTSAWVRPTPRGARSCTIPRTREPPKCWTWASSRTKKKEPRGLWW